MVSQKNILFVQQWGETVNSGNWKETITFNNDVMNKFNVTTWLLG